MPGFPTPLRGVFSRLPSPQFESRIASRELAAYPFCASFAHASFKVIVRFKISFPSVLSLSRAK